MTAAQHTPDSHTSTLSVLAVHPSPAMQESMQRVVRDFSTTVPDVDGDIAFSVETCANIQQASTILRTALPDVLLIDHQQSDPNAFALPPDILAAGSHVPIIIMTQTASIQAAVSATKQGAFDFLLQPFTPADFRNTLCRAARHVLLTRRARELEEEKRRVRFDFIRVLGHELKAPLGAVTTNIDIFKGRYLGEDITAYDELMGRCHVRLEQMRKLIVDLLDMTRLESGQKKRDLVPLDLCQAVRDAVELMTPQAQERGIGMHFESPPECMLLADRGEIDMILNNLVSNAVKYNRDNGEVTVTLTPVPKGVTIAVRDTGIGMSPEELEKLFGEFVRIRNKKTANILGSGLGLSILKRLTELYHGRVEVTSVENEGSTFTAFLFEDANTPNNADEEAANSP